MKVAIIGGGAAGFFSAFSVRKHHPNAQITIFEKTNKLLSKVKVSGGGRCNVTNACPNISDLAKAYPRGSKQLKKLFYQFNNHDMMDWLTARGVLLKTEKNGHIFPATDDSQTIIDCFLKTAGTAGIKIKKNSLIQGISPEEEYLNLVMPDGLKETFDKVITTTGGSPKKSGLFWLEDLGHEIIDPVPSLFTFNMPSEEVTKLMGVSVDNASVKVQGTKLAQSGPLLITHWGMSGPAILKLSAYGARELAEKDYTFSIQVNWANEQNFDVVQAQLDAIVGQHPNKQLSNIKPFSIPERLWLFLLQKSELDPSRKWNELGKKGLNKLTNTLVNDIYQIKGKTTFKEEFVTCGGVSLQSVNMNTLQSKTCKGLYFAGEVLDIDGITGGYNFQAAWTTGFVAGMLQE